MYSQVHIKNILKKLMGCKSCILQTETKEKFNVSVLFYFILGILWIPSVIPLEMGTTFVCVNYDSLALQIFFVNRRLMAV